jgi:hypothetical protein
MTGSGLISSAAMPFQPNIAIVTTVDGSVTKWTPAAHRLFTITGVVKVRIFGDVSETLTEDNGDETIEVGVAGATAALIAQLAAPLSLAAGDIWTNGAASTALPLGFPSDWAVISDIDIDLTVAGTGGIDDGTIVFYAEWIPMSDGALLVPAVWD